MTDMFPWHMRPIVYGVPIMLSLLGISIVVNFALYDRDDQAKKFRRSPVATLTMTLFALVIYGVILRRVGTFSAPLWLSYMGLVLFAFSCTINIVGRFYLGSNWSDQVRIRSAHGLVKTGPYGLVRHPLYASTIWMIFAAGLIYGNWLVLVLNAVVFVPAMVYRARQEEVFLQQTFPEYADYQQETGMLFPKYRRSKKKYRR